MATRHGRKGDYLLADDYTGNTIYASQAQRDYWGALTLRPLNRNLQEISSPLNDPQPVHDFRGPAYEQITECEANAAPQFVGLTLVPTSKQNAYFEAFDPNPAIPDMIIGCTFVVAGPPNPIIVTNIMGTDGGGYMVTDTGDYLGVV